MRGGGWENGNKSVGHELIEMGPIPLRGRTLTLFRSCPTDLLSE